MQSQEDLAFIGLTGLFILAAGWMFFGIAASGAWSERVMPKSLIKKHLIFALGTTTIGAGLLIYSFMAK